MTWDKIKTQSDGVIMAAIHNISCVIVCQHDPRFHIIFFNSGESFTVDLNEQTTAFQDLCAPILPELPSRYDVIPKTTDH